MSNAVVGSKPYVRSSIFRDCTALAETMREEDKREIWHLARSSPLNALMDGMFYGEHCWTVQWGHKVVAMFGVTRDDEVSGTPWMLASDDLKKIKKSFLRECHSYVELMFKDFDVLTNYVWAENTVHIEWLKWLGFKFLPAKPMGYDGELFYEFYKVK